MEKCAFIYNPYCGKEIISTYKDNIVEMLTQKYDVSIYKTTGIKHATEVIRTLDNSFNIAITAGGDGTFKEAIEGYMKRDNYRNLVLSHLPCGTTNDTKRNFYKYKNILENVKEILNGKEADLDVFAINGDICYYVAALGFLTNVSYDASKELKEKIGYAAYLVQVLHELRKPIPVSDIKLTVDGIKYHDKFFFISASNTNNLGGFKSPLLKDTKYMDERFELNLLKYRNNFKLQPYCDFIKLALGIKPKNLLSLKGHSCHLSFKETPTQCWTLDGEKRIVYDRKLDKEIDIKQIGQIRMLVPEYGYQKIYGVSR